MASTVRAMPSAWRVTRSSRRTTASIGPAFVIYPAVQMARHEATYGQSAARLTPFQCNLTE